MVMLIRTVFEDDDVYYPQVILEECSYKLPQ